MKITGMTAQLRRTDMDASTRFHTGMLGLAPEFRHEDFYAGSAPARIGSI